MKILLVNGPNLDMLGVREPAVYGSNTLADLEKLVVDYGASKGVSVECYARETFRHISVIAPACVAQVKGRGFKGYCDAIDILLEGPRERLGEGFEERYPAGEVIAAPLK